jgi:hypothetical protein
MDGSFVCTACGNTVPEFNRTMHSAHCRGIPNAPFEKISASSDDTSNSCALHERVEIPVATPVNMDTPQHPSSSSGPWVCPICTFHNIDGDGCRACDTPRNPHQYSSSNMTSSDADNHTTIDGHYWECNRCTFQNGHDRNLCEMCGSELGGNGEVRPPDATVRERLIDEVPSSSWGRRNREDNESNSGSDSNFGFARVVAGALIGGALGGVASMIGGSNNNRGFMRMAIEGASLGALSSALTAETEDFMSLSNHHRNTNTRSRTTISTSYDGNRSSVQMHGLDFETMLRLFFSNHDPNGGLDIDNMTYDQLLERFGAGRNVRGASTDAISNLPSAVLDEDDIDANGEANCCSVCLEPFEKGAQCTILPCNHRYHQKCIEEWLRNVNNCPVCKSSI